MKDKTQKEIELSCHSPALKSEHTLRLGGEAFLAITQALQFVIENKELFMETQTECPDCFSVVEDAHENFSETISALVKHYREEHAN